MPRVIAVYIVTELHQNQRKLESCSVQECTSKHDYSALENQPKSLIYEAISLISIGDLYYRQKSLNGSLILSACLPITQWPVNMVTVVDMTSQPRPRNWLVGLLSIRGQVSRAVKQDFSLSEDRLASLKNLHARFNLGKASGMTNSIEDDSERSAPALASSPALQFPGKPFSYSRENWYRDHYVSIQRPETHYSIEISTDIWAINSVIIRSHQRVGHIDPSD